MRAFVYILECADGSLYTGYTTDLSRRVKTHAAGKGAKYTRSRLPCRLVYSEECASAHEAMHREYEIKQLTRAEKLLLVQGGDK